MDQATRHIAQWKHNRDFLQNIPPRFNDWMIVAVFYASLHAVDTLLATRKDEAQDHKSRNGKLSQTRSYEKIWKSYRPLYELSRSIRYHANPAEWVAHADIEPQVITRYLYPIEKSVIKLAGLDETKLGFELIRIQSLDNQDVA